MIQNKPSFLGTGYKLESSENVYLKVPIKRRALPYNLRSSSIQILIPLVERLVCHPGIKKLSYWFLKSVWTPWESLFAILEAMLTCKSNCMRLTCIFKRFFGDTVPGFLARELRSIRKLDKPV